MEPNLEQGNINTKINEVPRTKQPFRFKQFVVDDTRCAMKVGTDAVLLGAWVDVSQEKRILDIGTGSGVIALMLAQRTLPSARIDAVEMVEQDYRQAVENFNLSPWREKLSVYHTPIQTFKPFISYDLIVSNPPFFSNSFLPQHKNRAKARHTETLSYEELLTATRHLLSAQGRFCVILPTDEGEKFRSLALANGFYANKITSFFSRVNKPQERWLFEFSLHPSEPINSTLVLYNSTNNEWSTEYQTLTRDYYLDRQP
jgi:tRNA1Val (adenine37-N6)-methyltransferase